MKRLLFYFLLIGGFIKVSAQSDSSIIQLSGLILTSDSLKSMPFVAVKNSRNRVIGLTDYEGFFSVPVRMGDTITFSILGYNSVRYIVPIDLKTVRHSIAQVLEQDVIYLKGATVRAYPKKEEILYNLEHGNFQDDAYETAKKNTSRETTDRLSLDLGMDAAENYRAYMNSQYQRYYWIGQTPPMRLLDPLAWNEFLRMWKAGKYKRKR